MAYSKEYYETHKEQLKINRQKYLKKNKNEINKRQRERYNNLSEEEKQLRSQKQREKRAKNPELSRIQYKIDMNKRYLKKYENSMFMLNMVDTWSSSDYRLSDELHQRIMYYKNKIEELQKEKENLINARVEE